jgi:hypothetical protein
MKKAGEGPAKVLGVEDPRVNAMERQVKTLKTLVEDLVHSKHDVKVNILSASCQCPPMQYVLLSRQRQDIYVKSSPKSPRGPGEGQEKSISPDTAKIMAVVEGALQVASSRSSRSSSSRSHSPMDRVEDLISEYGLDALQSIEVEMKATEGME